MLLEKIHRIANHYGLTKQQRQLAEECAELIQATSKYMRFEEGLITKDDILVSTEDSNLLIQNIVEEIADVEVIIEQVKYLLHINPMAIEEIKEKKVDRQLLRMEKEV